MSYDRGLLAETTDWMPSTSSIPLQFHTPSPIREIAIHRSVASSDGSRIAIPVRLEDNTWSLHIHSTDASLPQVSPPFTAMSHITPCKKSGFCWLAQTEDGWIAFEEQEVVSGPVDFAWNLTTSASGSLSFETQSDRQYTPYASKAFWLQGYENTFGLHSSSDGNTSAAVVQTTPIAEGDLETFRSGCFTLATQDGPWSQRFTGAYTPVLSKDGATLAADVRLHDKASTIAVNDQCWSHTWSEVWAPVIHPLDAGVYAPVKEDGLWRLFRNDSLHWESSWLQLWELSLSDSGKRMAAVISPTYGHWTLALDDTPWKNKVDGYLTRPVFSPCGSRLATTGRHKNQTILLIDDAIIDDEFLRVWDPVFSPYGSHEAYKVQKQEGFFIYLDGEPLGDPWHWVAPPRFSPDGQSLLICGIKKKGRSHHYRRDVVATE